MVKRLTHFLDINKLLPSCQFGFRKGLNDSDALVCITHDMQVGLDSGCESKIISLDFSSAFDRVNHKALLSKVRSIGIGGRFQQVHSELLTERRQHVTVECCFRFFSSLIFVTSQGSVLGPILFIIYTFDMWCAIESNMVAYADDTIIYAVIPSPQDRQRITNVLTRDVSRILSWCDR